MIDEQRILDSKISYIRKNGPELSNNEKISQLIEKIANEKTYWSKCIHQGHFTGQVNLCERIESSKVKLNDYFGDKRASIQELTRFICKSDSL